MNRFILLLLAFTLANCNPDPPLPTNPCPDTLTKTLDSLWATPAFSASMFPSRSFVFGEDLVYSYNTADNGFIAALDVKTGKKKWENAMERIHPEHIKSDGENLYYVAQRTDKMCRFDPKTRSESTVFQADANTLLAHKFGMMGHLAANLTREPHDNPSYMTSKVFVTDLRTGKSRKVFETDQPLNVISFDESAFAFLDFALNPSGDTLLCLMENKGYASPDWLYQCHSINLNTGEVFSAPTPFFSDLNNIVVDINKKRAYCIYQSGLNCIDLENAVVIWTSNLNRFAEHKLFFDGQRLVVFNAMACYAFDPLNGQEKWATTLGTNVFIDNLSNLASELTKVYLAAGNNVLTLDLSSGCLLERCQTSINKYGVFWQPVIDHKNDKIYLCTTERIFAYKKP